MEQIVFPLQEYSDSKYSSAIVYAIQSGKMPRNVKVFGLEVDTDTDNIIITYTKLGDVNG